MKTAPDIRWLPFMKMIFGIILLLILAGLSAIIALGKVESSTSHGLDTLLGGLLTLSGGFAHWAFQTKRNDDRRPETGSQN